MPARSARGTDLVTLAQGLRAFAEMLDANRQMLSALRRMSSSKTLKGLQAILGNKGRLAAAVSASNGGDVSLMYSAIQQLGGLQPKLSNFANLSDRDQSSVVKQVERIARDIRNVADRLEASR